MHGTPQTTIPQLEKAISAFKQWAINLQLTKEEVESMRCMLKPVPWLHKSKNMPDSAFKVAFGYYDWVQRKKGLKSQYPWGYRLHLKYWPADDQPCPFMCREGRIWYRREPRPDIVLQCMVNDLAAMKRAKNKGAKQ